jgi:hypothetical protein
LAIKSGRFFRSIGERRTPWPLGRWWVVRDNPSFVIFLRIGEDDVNRFVWKGISRYSWFFRWRTASNFLLSFDVAKRRRKTLLGRSGHSSIDMSARVDRGCIPSRLVPLRWSVAFYDPPSPRTLPNEGLRRKWKKLGVRGPLLTRIINSCRTLFFAVFWYRMSSVVRRWECVSLPDVFTTGFTGVSAIRRTKFLKSFFLSRLSCGRLSRKWR